MRGIILLIIHLFIVASTVFGKEPLTHYQTGFLENKGQVNDQYGNTRSDVKYLFAGNGFKMILKDNSWSYEFYRLYPDKNNSSPVASSSYDSPFDLKTG